MISKLKKIFRIFLEATASFIEVQGVLGWCPHELILEVLYVILKAA